MGAVVSALLSLRNNVDRPCNGFGFAVKVKRVIRHYRSCSGFGFAVVVLALQLWFWLCSGFGLAVLVSKTLFIHRKLINYIKVEVIRIKVVGVGAVGAVRAVRLLRSAPTIPLFYRSEMT